MNSCAGSMKVSPGGRSGRRPPRRPCPEGERGPDPVSFTPMHNAIPAHGHSRACKKAHGSLRARRSNFTSSEEIFSKMNLIQRWIILCLLLKIRMSKALIFRTYSMKMCGPFTRILIPIESPHYH